MYCAINTPKPPCFKSNTLFLAIYKKTSQSILLQVSLNWEHPSYVSCCFIPVALTTSGMLCVSRMTLPGCAASLTLPVYCACTNTGRLSFTSIMCISTVHVAVELTWIKHTRKMQKKEHWMHRELLCFYIKTSPGGGVRCWLWCNEYLRVSWGYPR